MLKSKKIFLLLVLSILGVGFGNAQNNGNKRVHDAYGNWSFTAGVNMVDDSGTKGKDLFNTKENWNVSFPYTLGADYYINNQWSVSLIGSKNKYVSNKNIDSTGTIIEGFAADYMAVDLAARFYLGDIFTSYAFDPYVFLGAGYNKIGAYRLKPFENIPLDSDIPIDAIGYTIPEIGKITLNAGVGFNYWFAQKWGLNFNFTGKIAMASGEFKKGPNSVSDQAQMSLGLLYFLTKKSTKVKIKDTISVDNNQSLERLFD